MYDDDVDADDVNRTPTAFAWRNYQQPESYKSSLQKHQAHHGHAGKAKTKDLDLIKGHDDDDTDDVNRTPTAFDRINYQQIINNQSPLSQAFKSIKHIMDTRERQ